MLVKSKVIQYIKNCNNSNILYDGIHNILNNSGDFIEDWDIDDLQRQADAKFNNLIKNNK